MSILHTGNIQPGLDLEEHYGTLDAKRVVLIDKDTGEAYDFGDVNVSLASGSAVEISKFQSIPTVSVQMLPYSYYNQQSLASGYSYHGFAPAGSNPTTANFRIMRETLTTGEVLFGGSTPNFVHSWSGVSLASISYL